MITACSTGMLGLLATAGLRGSADAEPHPSPASVAQSAWVLFPLVTMLFLIVVFLIVVTPMTRRL